MNNLKNHIAKYDKIGVGYNTTRQADPYLFSRLFYLLSPHINGHYLDVGCGTGNYTIEFANRGIRFTGIDPSNKMLLTAKTKSDKVNWLSGIAEELPFSDNSFDGAIATLTIHHWKNIKNGFKEIARVIKPGSRLVIFTSSPEQMDRYWLNHYFPELIKRSALQMPSVEIVELALKNAGFTVSAFEKYFVQDDLKDLFLQCGKNRPEIYFDENIRRGISTFASLANRIEVEAGLKMLKDDIDYGGFQSVKQKYESDEGDYVFIIAEKQ